MNRLPEFPQIPIPARSDFVPTLQGIVSKIHQKLNALAGGRIVSHDSATTAAPTSGTWAAGDYVRNTAPAELGTAGSKYVIMGWVCVSGGTPGTWKDSRTLTGA